MKNHMALGTLLPATDQDVVNDRIVVGISDDFRRA